MSDERYETLPLPLLPCVAMCWARNGSNSLISSRQPRKSPFDVDPNIWSSPLNGRPLLDKNFTTDATLVKMSRQYFTFVGVGFEFVLKH